MAWFEKFGFEEDPFKIVDPMILSSKRIKWNRDDLDDKWQFQDFLSKLFLRYRIGMKVFGPIGSGKTWILRFLQESILEKDKKAIIIYTKLPRTNPTISTLYDFFLRSIKPYISKILGMVEKKTGPTVEHWKKLILDEDLAISLWHIYHKPQSDESLISEIWLAGEKPSLTDRKKLRLISTLEEDYRKIEAMRNLLELSHLAFSTCVLIVDEMENAPVAVARPLGDSLRDLLDSFYDRFGLVCSYTAERAAEELLDLGYGEYLYSRLERTVSLMGSIKPEHFINILRIHNECYRKKSLKVKDQLHPFTEEAIRRLLDLIVEARRFPRYLLECCGILASIAYNEGKDEIDETFIIKCKERLPPDLVRPVR